VAIRLDIDIEQGESLNIEFLVNDSDGNSFNLTGYSARGVIRRRYSSTGILLDLDPMVNSGVLPSGVVTSVLSGQQTADLPVGQFVYDIEAYSSTDVIKVSKGRVSVFPEVTLN
jgi:hypothetical protein